MQPAQISTDAACTDTDRCSLNRYRHPRPKPHDALEESLCARHGKDSPRRRLTRSATLAATSNTHRYRLIMRHFFEQHQLHHYALAPGQVLAHLRTVLPDYSEDDCQQDLKTLVDWGNLSPDWELGLASVRTIDDFKRRNVMYSATPDAIAIEALMVELESRGEQVGELDDSSMGRLWELLTALETAMAVPADSPTRSDQVRQAWDDIWLRFAQVAQSSNDYMGDMRRQERERLLDLQAFQLYKEALIKYLTRFVEGLAAYRERINTRVQAWDDDNLVATAGEAALATTHTFETREHVLRRYREQVESFKAWFVAGGSADQLRGYASHAIERVVRSARRLSESRQGAVSRAHDLLALADRFFACRESLTRSERLAAGAFGLTHPRHWQLELPEQASDQAGACAWEASPVDTVIRQRRTQSPRRSDQSGSAADAEKKALLRARDRQRQQDAAALVDRLFAAGPLVLSRIQDFTPEQRDLVLSWIYECLANAPGYTTRAEDGSTLQIANQDETRYIWLAADDGRILIPDYRLERQGEGTPDRTAVA